MNEPGGITQTILASDELLEVGVYGNCMQAAIATVLGRPLDGVPHFAAFAWWPGALRLWLQGEDLDYTVISGPEIPQERAMLVGKSCRGHGHAVVSEHGRIVWDPHPSRAGLTEITGAYVIHDWDGYNNGPALQREADKLRVLLDRAEAQRDRLLRAEQRVRELHHVVHYPVLSGSTREQIGVRSVCVDPFCLDDDWPCSTIKALDGDA